MTQAKTSTYKQAGVDIDAGDALIEKIKPFAKATQRSGCIDGLGGFGALFDLKQSGYEDPILVSATDGVGTKLKIAHQLKRHTLIGVDLVAMCVNDLVVQGAEPLFFLDYFATGKLSVEEAATVIEGIALGCQQAGCALIGGETAEMPGMYQEGEYDLAGFAVGAVDRDKLLPQGRMKVGDVVLGLASSGLHSNGYSLVRHIMQTHNIDYNMPAPFASGKTLGDVFLEPTRIYVKSCLKALADVPGAIRAFSHITGGGLDNIPRVLPKGLAADLMSLPDKMPPVFEWLKEHGNVPISDMRRTFNCGVGMVAIVDAGQAADVMKSFQESGEVVDMIGRMVPGNDQLVITHD